MKKTDAWRDLFIHAYRTAFGNGPALFTTETALQDTDAPPTRDETENHGDTRRRRRTPHACTSLRRKTRCAVYNHPSVTGKDDHEEDRCLA